MAQTIWRELVNQGIHVAPVVVELDQQWRRDFGPWHNIIDTEIRSEGLTILSSGALRYCFNTFNLWSCYERFMEGSNNLHIDVHHRLIDMNRARLSALEAAIRLASVENVTDGAAYAEVELQLSEHVLSVIAPHDLRIIVDRMVDRSGFCRSCGDSAGFDVGSYYFAHRVPSGGLSG